MSNIPKSKTFLQLSTVPYFPGALCAQDNLDPETWYADDPVLQKIAKAYCYLCPYGNGPDGDDSCYEQGMIEERADNYTAHGVRGGRYAAERQQTLYWEKLRLEIAEAEDSE